MSLCGSICIRSWQMQSWSIWPIISLQDSLTVITSPSPQSSSPIIPTRLFQWLAQQYCLSLQVFSFGQEQQGPLKALFCPCAHISVHILQGTQAHQSLLCCRQTWCWCVQGMPWEGMPAASSTGALDNLCWEVFVLLLEARMRQNQSKIKFDIIQRGREMEHMEKEHVLTHLGVQPKTVIANRLNAMTPEEECLFCILDDS